ncbi:MAG: LptF/LptG family permease [Acidobacteriota bacterium]
MKKIHRIIYQEITPPALIALVVLTFVVFSREFGQLAELLIRKNADAVVVVKVVLFLLPGILVFTVPIGFLVGTLVGFSRLSTESEVVAMRSCGIGIYQILKPVLKVGVVVSLVTLILAALLLPAGNWNLRLLRQQVGVRPVQSQVKPRVFSEDLPGMLLYVEDIDLASGGWKGVFLADAEDRGRKRIILARDGHILFTPDARRLQLLFERGSSYEFDETDPRKYSLSQFGRLDVSVELPEIEPVSTQPKRAEDKMPEELLRDLRQASPETHHRSRIELNRRLALSLSPLLFAVLGVTLGITTHQGGRGYGSVVSLVVAFSYYVLFATGIGLAGRGALSIATGVWGANLVLLLAALLSLRHARQGLGTLHALANSRIPVWLFKTLVGGLRALARTLGRLLSELRRRLWDFSGFRLRLTRVVDLYLMRTFLLHLFPTLLICLSLFYLFTFFELVDDVFANNIPVPTLFEYFVYLLPHGLMLLVPISVLIAILTTFGLLEKTFQVVAFKACGISLYRIAVPVLALVILISGSSFVIQEYILPYANQRQDSLRNLIKGRPVQTFYHPGRNWIFGEGKRLYNYNYFDPERSLFAELSVYEIDIGRNRLRRHIYAWRAQWDRATQAWELHRGWIRDLDSQEAGYSTFDSRQFSLAEKPDYFVQEVKESSKMTYTELADYIQELQRGGFEVDHLRTELHKKIAFPMVSVVMVVLGIPFAFSVGKKGTLYGIASGILLGIVYWGAFGIFGVLGTHGLLSPLLAAWGPNLLFGAASLLLFLNVRT